MNQGQQRTHPPAPSSKITHKTKTGTDGAFTCCECRSTRNALGTNCACKKPVCAVCLEQHRQRAKQNDFYKQYVGTCDACIWFDIG